MKLEDFWKHVNVGNGDQCWNWLRGKSDSGYGVVWIEGRNKLAHRLAYILSYKDDVGKNLVLHTCDNRICCNPKHLKLGTYKDNIRDMLDRNRGNPPRGERCATSKLDSMDVAKIRKLYSGGLYTQKELSKRFNVSKTEISFIINNKRWRHI